MTSQFAPDTADGWAILHQFFQVDFRGLALRAPKELSFLDELSKYLEPWEARGEEGQSAAFHILGHKGQLLLLHFRKSFDQCAQAELHLSRMELSEFLEPSHSYVSVVEMGMYHTTKKVVQALEEKGLKPHSEEWKAEYEAKMEPHKENLMERRFTEIPERRYICFYPMNKRRGEEHNWYHEPLEKRAQLMMEHGMTGRRYAGRVQQIISGSIGFDDWEWGVDLFADDPGVFKQLVYEMRFDDATSLYGEFGEFFLGIRLPASSLSEYFQGKLP